MRRDIPGYETLEALALNLRSSWNHSADELWMALDLELWELTHNPWAVLQTVSREKLASLLQDPKFSQRLHSLVKSIDDSMNAESWFQKNHKNAGLTSVAYFSMEFMLSEALPIYSGGLGNVAGDQLKAASDLGVPVIGIGLLYSQGYFRQFIDKNGNQQELYPYNDPGQLPIKPLRLPNGEWLRLKIDLPGWSLWLRAWEVLVGRRRLYLLDSNDIANFPAHRGITAELYGGDKELRIKQELILGIGGWRLLEALGIESDICHMNEGHAAFVVLERASSYMKKYGVPFETALTATRPGNVFTTHTAVSAGFDRFPPELVGKYLGKYSETKLGIPFEKLLALGQITPRDDFNMAFLAIRGSGTINGVSRLHGEVSQNLFEALFPRWPQQEIPVGYVTNGVHTPSWDSVLSDALWTEACGKSCWGGFTDVQEDNIRAIPDIALWQMRNQARATLVAHARSRLTKQLAARGGREDALKRCDAILQPDVLTMGFARRFAAYKRPDLLLDDPERLLRILKNKDRPVQLIIAGKAHPADAVGHQLIKKWMDFISREDARTSVVFLSDYDMNLTEYLVQGVDLWINTPERPWEACGTSGMKVLVNGGLNLSELDGWWAEAYTPDVGWALGDGREHGHDLAWNRQEANALYDLLENEVVPQFYTCNKDNIPVAWTQKMRESMARLTPQYSAARAVREYTEKFYLPAQKAYLERSKDRSRLASQIVEWKKNLESHWPELRFGDVKLETTETAHRFTVQLFLGGLDGELDGALDRHAIKVELYAETLVAEMRYLGPIPNQKDGHYYQAEVPLEHPPFNFTPRVLPHFPGVVVPLEAHQILWQR